LDVARNRTGKISPQFVGNAAGHNQKFIRADALGYARRFRASGVAWNGRMGLFHCVTEDDGSKTVKQTPDRESGRRGK
jgi:hypothetical protein